MTPATVGIIANPASGKDIRRLVAHGSTFDNNEKINIVRRVLIGLDAVGIERVWFMPDTYGIVSRALDHVQNQLRLAVEQLPMPVFGDASDTDEAARRLADFDVGTIVILGGDGTNRMVAKGCAATPLVPISTGTNNVFPQMVEGTIAGIASGLIAMGHLDEAVEQRPILDVSVSDGRKDLALIDVVSSPLAAVGARAIWDATHISEVVLSRVTSAEIGMCGLGGLLFPELVGTDGGVHIVIGGKDRTVQAPIAPGLIRDIPIASAQPIAFDEVVELQSDAKTIALDGERELELFEPGLHVKVQLRASGPRVVNIERAIRIGAMRGAFDRLPVTPGH
jgi:predicted polyphosphate/ATP-dependent NAD kinase